MKVFLVGNELAAEMDIDEKVPQKLVTISYTCIRKMCSWSFLVQNTPYLLYSTVAPRRLATMSNTQMTKLSCDM